MRKQDGMKHDLIAPCACLGDHFMRLTWWEASETYDVLAEGYLSIGGSFGRTLWRRVKAAFGLIRNGHVETCAEVTLTAEDAREIADELLTFAEAADAAAESKERSGQRDPSGKGS